MLSNPVKGALAESIVTITSLEVIVFDRNVRCGGAELI